ncbi:hypothetical protein HYFRA_00005335 [Hymenoscyphus fraxineus]|uniref:Uncharacterized protein n=1 Tax=Hymenoscyphus fraxineus TaxID=746836 RepID=A0A9N9LDN6_9HELO|nr:hypothetical protein HYFRA_00005335 [Hymenoscyphus fraxineus]
MSTRPSKIVTTSNPTTTKTSNSFPQQTKFPPHMALTIEPIHDPSPDHPGNPAISPLTQMREEKAKAHFEYQKLLRQRNSCLQCQVKGLRCSFGGEHLVLWRVKRKVFKYRPKREEESSSAKTEGKCEVPRESQIKEGEKKEKIPERRCCKRCLGTSEGFCVVPSGERREGERVLKEDEGWECIGLEEGMLSARVEELLELKKEGVGFGFPIPEEEVEKVRGALKDGLGRKVVEERK